MSSQALGHIRGLAMPSSQKLVLYAIADHADSFQACSLTNRDLRRITCLRETAVRCAIGGLQRAGHIRIERETGAPNRFTVLGVHR